MLQSAAQPIAKRDTDDRHSNDDNRNGTRANDQDSFFHRAFLQFFICIPLASGIIKLTDTQKRQGGKKG